MAVTAVNLVTALVALIAAVIYSGQTILVIQKLNELLHWKLGCNPIPSVGNVTLHYFAIRGRGEAIRLLLEDQLIPYTETKFTEQTWQEAKEAGTLAGIYTFGQVPAIVTSNNKQLVQSKIILQFLGRSVGLDCDCRDLERCDIIAAGIDDLNRKRSSILYNPDVTYAMRDKYVHETLVTWLYYFENLAPQSSAEFGGIYFASERLTWIDYLVFDMIESNCNFIEHTVMDANSGGQATNRINSCDDLLQKFPRLRVFFNNFKDRANIAVFLKSERRLAFTIPYQLKLT